MNPIVYHIASGQAFFTGALALTVAVFLAQYGGARRRRLVPLVTIVGLLAVVVTSTPLPPLIFACLIVATLGWMGSYWFPHARTWASRIALIAWVGATTWEATYHATPSVAPVASRSLAVVGDSLTAGMGTGDATEKWPTKLARQRGLTIDDISHMGETAGSAVRRLAGRPVVAPLVVLEIGGNDLFASATPEAFAAAME
ncbi:MAG: SGNH/GDSL hydrolase family protein, partial [Planctomycetales bacterium]|nr:SGNH/GDSL hydrolase family protein [Planctomycetales bacterium]